MTLTYKIEKKNIRSLRIRLTSRHTFVVSAPIFTPQFIIKNFINANQNWIETHAKKIPITPKISRLKTLKILDETYSLIFHQSHQDSLVIDKKTKQIFINSPKASSPHLKKLLDKKLRPYALQLIKDELKILAAKYHFKYNKVTLRNQSSRYGSCSSYGNLSFNWQIIFFPAPIFRHLLLHELTHLSVKNHKKEFWDQLKVYDPDAKIHNRYIKLNSKKHLIC
jgi:hypothetical protein